MVALHLHMYVHTYVCILYYKIYMKLCVCNTVWMQVLFIFFFCVEQMMYVLMYFVFGITVYNMYVHTGTHMHPLALYSTHRQCIKCTYVCMRMEAGKRA